MLGRKAGTERLINSRSRGLDTGSSLGQVALRSRASKGEDFTTCVGGREGVRGADGEMIGEGCLLWLLERVIYIPLLLAWPLPEGHPQWKAICSFEFFFQKKICRSCGSDNHHVSFLTVGCSISLCAVIYMMVYHISYLNLIFHHYRLNIYAHHLCRNLTLGTVY